MNMKRWMVVLAMGLTACDPGGKSVTETAEEGGESEGEGGSSEEGGSMSSTSVSGGNSATETGADPSMTGGSESGDEPEVPACLETRTELGPDEETPLGFNAGQVLLETREFQQTFMLSEDTGSIVIEGAGIETELALSIQPGPAYYVESVPNPEYMDFDPQGCESRFEMDVTVRFDTADGRFAEVLDEAVLVAYEVSTFTWSQRIAPDGFMGTFSEDDISYEDGTGDVEYFELSGQVTGGESTGALWGMGILNPDALDEDLAYAGTFGTWPAGGPGE